MTGGQMAMLTIFFLLPCAIILYRILSERRREKRMKAAAKKKVAESVEAAKPQPPAGRGRMVIPEIMAELNAVGEAMDISRYALEASLGMHRTAWKATCEAHKDGYERDGLSGQALYETPGNGPTSRTQPAYYEDDLDDWHFSDDNS